MQGLPSPGHDHRSQCTLHPRVSLLSASLRGTGADLKTRERGKALSGLPVRAPVIPPVPSPAQQSSLGDLNKTSTRISVVSVSATLEPNFPSQIP